MQSRIGHIACVASLCFLSYSSIHAAGVQAPACARAEVNGGAIDAVPARLVLPPAESGGIRVRFAGVSTLVFEEDGEPALMTDGFFSRPSLRSVALHRIGPDQGRIDRGLCALGLKNAKLQAVIPLHAHYDHAMDSPTVAQMTTAKLVGDISIANIGLGGGLHPNQIDVVLAGQTKSYGRWRVTFIAADHAPTLLRFRGTVKRPLKPDKRVFAWREGQPWTLLIEHDNGKRFLIHASAGYRRGEIARALAGRRVDVVFLGIGGAGRKASPQHREQLWAETVRAADAARVIPIHWDDFFEELKAPLQPMSSSSDNLARTVEHYECLAEREHREIRFPPLFEAFDPYDSLPSERSLRAEAVRSDRKCR